MKDLFSLGSDSLQGSCIASVSDVMLSFCSLPELQSHVPDCLLIISSGMGRSLFFRADCDRSKNNLHFFFLATNQLFL